MKGFPWYRSDPTASRTEPAVLPPSRRVVAADPQRYVATAELVDAVNVALLLGQPLLLTGEPGTGKTLLASSVAWQLGLPPPLRFDVKSTSTARDLFYAFDALGRFQAVQAQRADAGPLPWITWGPLGLAILRALPPADVADLCPRPSPDARPGRSVVLIDEIDKAPRDFPNDILVELEDLAFRVPELGQREVRAPADLHPVVVFTSNSEKSLPDAFLRRCTYHDLRFPDRERLEEILAAQLGAAPARSPLVARALRAFEALRDPALGLQKRPATAELIAWIVALEGVLAAAGPRAPDAPVDPRTFLQAAHRTLGVLVKQAADRETAERALVAAADATSGAR